MVFFNVIVTNWALLCLLGGAMDGIGQLLCKNAWRPPPYVIVGMLGIMWFLCPILLMSMGHVGPFAIMSLGQAAALGGSTLLLAVIVGLMFWADNLTRFDASNKAPFVGFVIMIVEISAALTAFGLQIASGKAVAINYVQACGIGFAILATICFWFKKLTDERAQKKEEKKYEPFIPLNWVVLSVITGVFSGLGGIVYKDVADTMPLYVFTGIIGFTWVIASLMLMSFRGTWLRMGLRLKVLSFGEAARYGWVVFGLLIFAGILTWLANMGRFGAVRSAPYVGYVYLLFPIALVSLALVLEYGYQHWQHKKNGDKDRPMIGISGWCGIAFAVVSLVFFTL